MLDYILGLGIGGGAQAIPKFEKVTVTIADSASSATQNLSSITNHAYCIPFATWRPEPRAQLYAPGITACLVEMINNAGTPAVRVSRGDGSTGGYTLVVVVYVAQFDPALVRITQTVSTEASSGSLTEDHTLSPAVTLAKTFVVGYWRPDSFESSNSIYKQSASVHLSSTTNVRFTRGDAGSSAKFASYVAEDINGNVFDVQHVQSTGGWWGADDLTVNVAKTGTLAISSVAVDRTFVLGSASIALATEYHGRGIYSFSLGSATTIRFRAGDADTNSDVGELRAQAVTFKIGVISKIVTGESANGSPYTGNTSTLTLNGTVVVAKSIVIPPSMCQYGHTCGEGLTTNWKSRPPATHDLTSTTQITVTHSTDSGAFAYSTWAEAAVLEFL